MGSRGLRIEDMSTSVRIRGRYVPNQDRMVRRRLGLAGRGVVRGSSNGALAGAGHCSRMRGVGHGGPPLTPDQVADLEEELPAGGQVGVVGPPESRRRAGLERQVLLLIRVADVDGG